MFTHTGDQGLSSCNAKAQNFCRFIVGADFQLGLYLQPATEAFEDRLLTLPSIIFRESARHALEQELGPLSIKQRLGSQIVGWWELVPLFGPCRIKGD